MLTYLYNLDYEDRDWDLMEEIDEYTTIRAEAGIDLVNLLEVPIVIPEQNLKQYGSSTASDQRIVTANHLRMLNNISVYAMAEKYDVPMLKGLAKDKFEDLAMDTSIYQNFTEIIRTVYETTPDNDDGLRSAVTGVCTANVPDFLRIAGHNGFQIDGIEQLWFDVLSAHKDKTDEESEHLHILHSKIDDELRTKSQEACHLESDIENLHTQLDSQKHMIDAIFNSSKTLQVCKPCGRPMYLEQDTSQTCPWAKLLCPECGYSRPVPRF